MKKIILLLSFITLAPNSFAAKSYNWLYTHKMEIQHFESKSMSKREVLDTLRFPLSKNIAYCIKDEDENLEKTLKKEFNGCDISYQKDNSKLEAEIECGNSNHQIKITQSSRNEFDGIIKYEEKNNEFHIKASGLINIKKQSTCN